MKALVTGGGGFLGRHIVAKLLARGDKVRVLGRRGSPDLEKMGVEVRCADIQDTEAVERACLGMEAVFHVAARAGYWGSWDSYYGPNVVGTRNVLNGCRKAGLRKLIYTSTPSVVSAPGNLEHADEQAPYPDRYDCPYPATKAEAERLVLGANGTDGLLTVSLRPHLIYGPGDPHLFPRIIDRARKGLLVQVGDGTNKVDVTYVENAADAHLLAADRLGTGTPVGGQAYFISQGTPVLLWPWINSVLAALGIPGVHRTISHGAARAVGAAMEMAYTVLPLRGEPRMTRFLADQLATSHYFDISKARADLGYEPRIGTEEGLARTIKALQTA
ncbi:MAG: NAD-dependent epimerase/dehydratase family protein [Nitrospirae bacterium]|nr:MAG: NAD-dependent epimerase/dehydratase family protein [Nitrospirota bacterium]